MDDPFVIVGAIVFIVETLVAIWCAWDMRRIYGRRLMDSLLWKRLIDSEIRTVVAGIIILVVSVYSLIREVFGWPPIARPWGTLALLVALGMLMYGPIADWWTLRRIGRGDR